MLEPEERIPELYTDAVRIGVGTYDFLLELGLQEPVMQTSDKVETPATRVIARVRMSPQHALVMAKLLQKNVDLYEDKVGKINLPPMLYKEFGIADD